MHQGRKEKHWFCFRGKSASAMAVQQRHSAKPARCLVQVDNNRPGFLHRNIGDAVFSAGQLSSAPAPA